ncbi:TonB-dependent receptor [Planctobacterium marinum]|uniref:TonB-dependent receptor n=1 Tax=Planctobacterium marinum TaxID=1631968 RepID=UPI001E565325|nr:TonB-dependent receptor [Planctobacterium marinum]MCC2606961.1 TonB-dependent receptor [Planctobacterium marinum]
MQHTTFRKSILGLACGLVLSGAPAHAEGDLSGKVTSADTSIVLEGALVEIPALNLKEVTSRDGRFRFHNLKDGLYQVRITYLGAETKTFPIEIKNGENLNTQLAMGGTEAALEELLVVGQRASQASALNRQKNAKRVTSIVSADAIGQFPDQNVAESLQRLPGMFIQRDQGEGRFVGIRGIDPNLNNLTINGVNIPSPESGVRSVAMDVIPSELVDSLEVSKTVTPDMDADAVGGSIEVKSLSGLDRPANSFSFTGQLSQSQLRDETSPKLSGSYSTAWDLQGGNRFALATAVSWAERKFGSDNMEVDGGWGHYDIEDDTSGEEVEIFSAEEIEQRAYWIKRERTGLALNLDYQTADSDYYLRTLYSVFSDDEYRLRNEYKLSDGNLLSYSDNAAQFIDAEMDRDTKDRFEEQKIWSSVLGGETRVDSWTLEYSVSYAKSSEDEPGAVEADFKGEELQLGYTALGQTPTLTQSANAHDLANFELDEIIWTNNLTEDDEVSFKFDASHDFVWNNHNATFKTGMKYRSREKFLEANVTVFDGGFNDATGADFALAEVDWGLGSFGPGINRTPLRNFFNSNLSGFEINDLDTTIESSGASYESGEDIFAAYAMLDLDLDKWNIIVGLRYEDTQFTTSGNRVELIVDDVADIEEVVVTPWNVEKDYDHLLPSLNVRYDFNDKLLARFAYTQTIARPSFEDSAAFQLIANETEEDDGEIETVVEAEVGNPHLDPYESQNLDLSIEYYPGHIGILSAGLFYKDIDNFIVLTEVQDNGQWDGFDEVLQPVNGGSASITGIELAWAKTFQNGLLFSANATFTDSDDALPNQADRVGNLAIGYENNQLSARLTWSHKSESFQFDDQDAPVYEDVHNQLDLNVKYYINDNMHLYVNGVNLNDEPLYLYHNNSRYAYQYETYGRTFEIGFSWNSF